MSVRQLRLVLTVADHEYALAFYRDTLGLPQLEDWSSQDGSVVLLEAGRATLELIDPRQAEMIDEIEVGSRVADTVRIAFEVDDSAARADTLEAAGAERLGGPVDTPWRDRNVRVRAADGMQITLFAGLGE